MDHLTDLLNFATSADAPGAGQDRVQALIAKLREMDGVDPVTLEQSAAAQFETLYADGQYNPDDTDKLEALADITEAARALSAEQQQAAAERDQRVASLAERVRTPVATSQEDSGAGAGDTNAAPEQSPEGGVPAAHDQAPDQPAGTTPATATDGNSAPVGGEESAPAAQAAPSAPTPQPQGGTPPVTPSPQLVTASSARPVRRTGNTASAVRNSSTQPAAAPQQQPQRRRSFAIVASAEIPDVPSGKNLSREELADAALARFATFPVGQQTNGVLKANVARIKRIVPEEFQLTGDRSDIAKIDAVCDEKRLEGGSLVAASMKALTAAAQAPSTANDVWCSPSETDYTLCPSLATVDGTLDLPSTTVTRGGIRYPVWTDYPEQAADAAQNGWHGVAITYPAAPASPGAGLDNPKYFHSEDNGGLGNTKRCISGPCVTWEEERQSLAYLCVTSDVLRDQTFPEATRKFIDEVLVHHTHYLNEIYIQHILARSDVLPAFSVMNGAGSIGSTSTVVTDRLRLLVTWFRNVYKMAEGTTLELVGPEWFREYLKRDIELKANRPYGSVTNLEIAAIFAQYTSRVQWVRDWQELASSGTPGGVSGKLMPPTGWPSAVNFIAYPAGSWALSESPILNLGVQYDYQLLQENRYSAMFTEDSWLLLNRCNRSFVIQLNELCANGAVGPYRDACATTPDPVPGSSEDNPLFTQEVAAA